MTLQTGIAVHERTDKPDLTVDPRTLGDEALDGGIKELLSETGDVDRDLLAVMLVERHRRARLSETSSWLTDCETLFLLATEVYVTKWRCKCGLIFDPVEDASLSWRQIIGQGCPVCGLGNRAFQPAEERPLWMKYAPDGTWTWGSFALDILEVPISTATARKRIWEVYRQRLCWTPEVLAHIGPSRLSVAVAEVERSLDDGKPDDELEGMLLGDGSGNNNSDWRDVWLYVQGKGDERRRLAGKPARIKFREKPIVDGETGEIMGFGLSTWLDDLIYELGEFRWNPELPDEVRDTLEAALIDALQRGPRRL